jgi:hypothetical protein
VSFLKWLSTYWHHHLDWGAEISLQNHVSDYATSVVNGEYGSVCPDDVNGVTGNFPSWWEGWQHRYSYNALHFHTGKCIQFWQDWSLTWVKASFKSLPNAYIGLLHPSPVNLVCGIDILLELSSPPSFPGLALTSPYWVGFRCLYLAAMVEPTPRKTPRTLANFCMFSISDQLFCEWEETLQVKNFCFPSLTSYLALSGNFPLCWVQKALSSFLGMQLQMLDAKASYEQSGGAHIIGVQPLLTCYPQGALEICAKER